MNQKAMMHVLILTLRAHVPVRDREADWKDTMCAQCT